MNSCLILGAGGFIGSHLYKKLKLQGHYVTGVDLKYPEYFLLDNSDKFIIGDLRNQLVVRNIINSDFDEIYVLAAEMGGANFIFTGNNDADIMHNSAIIHLNVLDTIMKNCKKIPKVFFSSSACVYSQHNQTDPNNPICSENSAFPADPDSCYGWEKLFAEQLYLAFNRNKNIPVRIARFHNIFGEKGTWNGGREKSPAAICRKIAMAPNNETIEIYGDGKQTRSFLYIDECLDAIERLMASDFIGPLNIGSDEMVSINQLAKMIMQIANKTLTIKHIDGPLGVRGRCSDNTLIYKILGWKPTKKLEDGLRSTYQWIEKQIKNNEA